MASDNQDIVHPAKSVVGDRSFSFARPGVRQLLIAFGWLNVAVAMVGIVVPGLPTTIFLIIALWAFSKSSRRFHDWLYNHRRFGPPLRQWSAHRVIPPKAKGLAVGVMVFSWLIITLYVANDWMLPVAVGATLMAVAAYILTRPSRVGG